jgi:hypothetical protein
MLGLVGCNPRNIVLGRGEADAAVSSSAVSSTDSTDATLEVTSGALPSSAGAASSDATGANTGVTSSTVVIGSFEGAGSSAGDFCDDAFAACEERTPGEMCQDVLIYCRITVPDGGPVCEDVYSDCLALGYPEQDCRHATTTCEGGDGFVLAPEADSTLHVDEATVN